MCGIVGYVGGEEAAPILVSGLSRLEYRGYDSAGLAVVSPAGLETVRAEGKLAGLIALLRERTPAGQCGIGHTRWATHGPPSERNAHPHVQDGVAVVHNGIIENHLRLRAELQAEGCVFASDTDTEIFAHLISRELGGGAETLTDAVRAALSRVEGTYALAVLCEGELDQIVVAKNASPLVIGLAEGATLVASDVPALLDHTRDVIFLEEGEVATVTRQGVTLTTFSGEQIEREPTHITWSPVMAEKGGHKHFMHKEIHEQPRAVADTLAGRVELERADVALEHTGLEDDERLKALQRVVIVACGTSWHAGLVGKFLIERLARIPVEVDLASEFRYRDPLVDGGTLLVPISQSGETADTLAALGEAKAKGAPSLGLVNVVGSAIARQADGVLYTHAGPEIGVASTKCFTTQLAALTLLAVRLGRARGTLGEEEARRELSALLKVPHQIAEVLESEEAVQRAAVEIAGATDALFLGRGLTFPIALEGALKLKEISYIHAEGYPSGEMKHGPIALIEEGLPVVVIATRHAAYEKTLANIEEVRARGGRIVAIATAGDEQIRALASEVLYIPEVSALMEPLVATVPLQLLAYHVADHRGTDVDQPRNLAKSVTVE
ncbi:MAG: glutamine--fructose-6-phosphate transaminase (isomerizing) [Deltaproteobacteria bacterium]|nr:glutamine--fructose-6-phosphate transaminase (isomerizing) [Deltaproteobacteria bacterium]